jgi:tetratricopeptide (TPR) repeat protein
MIPILLDDPHYQHDHYKAARVKPLALILDQVYDRQRAAKLLRERTFSSIPDIDILIDANNLYRSKSYRNARIKFENYLELNQLPVHSHFNYGKTLYLLDDYHKATDVFKQVLKDTIFENAYYYMSDCYFHLGQRDSSTKYIRLFYSAVDQSESYFRDLKRGLNLDLEMDHARLIGRWFFHNPLGRFVTWEQFNQLLAEQHMLDRNQSD